MLVIIHTGDLHDGLGDAEAARLAAIRDAHAGAILLDSGDAVGAGNLGFRPSGEPILRRMTGLGYTAMAMGNRETHVWQTVLEAKLKDAGFPVLCANITLSRPSDSVRPYLLCERDGTRIGLAGLTVPMVTQAMWTRHLCDVLFSSPLEDARGVSATLRPQADLLVLLSHLGERVDREIAAEGLFDVILGGHSHVRTETPRQEGRTWLCHTGSHARYAGVWKVAREGSGWRVTGGLEPLRSVP
jgi:5'-nucleotidase